MSGFKQFILRGNVVELAVAVVIGASFTAIVNALVTNLFNPLIGALFDAETLNGALILGLPTLSGGTAELRFGAVLAAVIQFVIVAAVVYFVIVVPVNRLNRLAALAEPEGPAPPVEAPPTEIELLVQIRDLLAGQALGVGGHASGDGHESGAGDHGSEDSGHGGIPAHRG